MSAWVRTAGVWCWSCVVGLSACSTTSPGAPAGVAAAPAGGRVAAQPAAAASAPASKAASAPASTSAPAGGPPPFATVIKDARKIEGLLTLWQRDEKVWIELKPADLARPFFLSPKLASGIGEAGLYGGSMVGRWMPWGRPQVVELRRIHNQVQMVARNDQFRAAAGSPEERAVKAAFSDSLLGSTAVASQPNPDTKAILVEAGPLFLSDMLGLGITLQRQYRQGYAFDARNSAITELRGNPNETMIRVLSHFGTGSLALPQPGTPANAPVPTLPSNLPDARSLFMTVHYSLTALPAEPMTPRKADPRVGYFLTQVSDFGNDLARTPRQRYVNRWRLEKKDPAAALSEPVKPITFWLDRNIPLKYRDTITRGVLAWNAAFEKIGFKNAVVVHQQADDADFDTLDTGVASIRWMTNDKPSFGAIGPSQVDPRTGEILDADIGIESLSSRAIRATRSRILNPGEAGGWAALLQSGGAPHTHEAADDACHVADVAAEQLSYVFDVLQARGELDPDSPQAEAFVQDYLLSTTLHEVGHTLGLRHNFRSSRIYTDAQLGDLAFTQQQGLAGSVMEYTPVNLALPGEPQGAYFQTVLGPYDYWAIEYAYKPLAPEQEQAELQRLAARSAEPQLAYGTDEDAGLGLDPETLTMDLGADPVVFARKRLAIARDLIHRQENRALKPTEDYAILRRAIAYALRDATRAVGVLTRQIGGVRTLRDFPGSGRDPLVAVPLTVQRDALKLLADDVLAADGWRVSPTLSRRLAVDFLERGEGVDGATTDFSVEAQVLEMQRQVLALVSSDAMAARLQAARGKVDQPGQALSLTELQEQLTRAIWSDALHERQVPAARRELQRDHVNRLAARLLQPAAGTSADLRAVQRSQARHLLDQLQTAARRGGLDGDTRDHLRESADALSQALKAPVIRAGV